jgi:hypothetical protein
MIRLRTFGDALPLTIMTSLLLAAAPASRPVLDQTLLNGQYHLASPPAPEWTAVNPNPAAESITFLNTKRDGAIQIALLPKDANVDPDISGSVAVAIIKELKRQRAAKHSVIVMQPMIEHDRRFAIVIHEKFKEGDETCDQLHVYKSVGPRVLMLTVNSVAKEPGKSASIHKAGEAALDSAKFDRKAFRKTQ